MTQYSATEYRNNLKNDYSTWANRNIVVRDASGALLVEGVVAGLQMALTFPPSAAVPFYGFTSGGPQNGKDLQWEPSQTVEVDD
ncbi:Uncharacterised protein [Mycolicibacterium phlei]|uniref:hypothetical protein n=1 Tax=Mycobacteroides chelonae TaxID=1774 RepID=UPI00096A9BE0|nr:hypothetical protein [Mycobacteroides chelonae]VEG16095.1 Uncharacterised protein [Mycolicibacterium phlei]